jgi:benzoate-CoA ligase family protein
MSTEEFNASVYLLDRRVEAGDGDRPALTGPAGELSYAALLGAVRRAAQGLHDIGLRPEQRLLMVVADSPGFVVLYLAAMRLGAVPVPVSTMLTAADIAELLRDSRAPLLAYSPEFAGPALAAADQAPELRGLVCTGARPDDAPTLPLSTLDELVAAPARDAVYSTTADSPAFWLYTSGTTGKPKGAMHRHGSVQVVCETYGQQVLGITREDRCISAAKAFFAYGLGNSLLFPLSVGASTILEPAPSRPDSIVQRSEAYRASLFFAGPTFFAGMLRADLKPDALTSAGVRLAVSAGEALPAGLYQRWTSRFGVDILDGIGMTETLHIFLSNRPGAVKAGTTGVAVPGYELRIVDDQAADVPDGEPGGLLVRAESAATGYWSRYAASRQVFQGEWVRTGDTYVRDFEGYYSCLGRTGDMLKAGGIWVSPAEVEARLLAHDAVAQAIVVAGLDPDGLEKPVAFVVLAAGTSATEDELIAFCRDGLPAFKRPRRVMFVEAYPTTATGKIRRVELRGTASTILTS